MAPSNWLLWDRIRDFARGGRIYQQEKIFQDQSDLNRLATGSDFYDFSKQSSILNQTNLQINRLERYKDYEQMDQTGEMFLALDLYADEASLIDLETKHSLVIRANNKQIKKELEELFFNTLLWDNDCRSIIRYVCKYGDFAAEIIPTRNRNGVSAMRFMNIYNFTRLETKYGELVGFYYQDELTPEPIFLHPWSCMHIRLTSYENTYTPYGRSIIDGSRKSFKQLRLMEDAALIYRITRSPEKRVFKIPVGSLPPSQIPEYMQAIARSFKRQRFYNPTSGTFDERYSPMTQEDDFFLPMRQDGVGPTIDTLPGAENLDQIADIEYFKKKMIAPTKIPFARVGIGSGAGESNDKSLSQSHAEFAKAVRWVQSKVALGITKLAIVHLALRGYSEEDCKGFELSLASTSAMEDLYRMETWQTRVGVMADLKDIGWFPKEFIITKFTDLPPDEIEEIIELEETNDEESSGIGGMGGGMGGSDFDSMGEMDDMGGDDMDDSGMGDDMGGGNEGMGMGDDMGGGDEDVDDELKESVDYEKMLIKKVATDTRRRNRSDFIRRLHNKKNNNVITSSFDYLLESNELDNLQRDDVNSGVINESDEPDEYSNRVVVISNIEPSDAEQVKEEVKSILIKSRELQEDYDCEELED